MSDLTARIQEAIEDGAWASETDAILSEVKALEAQVARYKPLEDFIAVDDCRLSELDWLRALVTEYERLIRTQTEDRDPDAEADGILAVKRLYELLRTLAQSRGIEMP